VSSSRAAQDVTNALKQAHGGQTDFTVLQADDNLALAGTVLGLITNVVAAIAAVSLIVGGIGIMNIMLVSVSERTHEIGVRKAVGATNKQILRQFMTEAVVLSVTGGILGVVFAILVNYLLRIFTNLQPVVTLPVVAIAVMVATVVGTIFGMAPALQASRKDPIEALRRI
jgi:putative ABC transport system permease protein